jgi:plastocyanin
MKKILPFLIIIPVLIFSVLYLLDKTPKADESQSNQEVAATKPNHAVEEHAHEDRIMHYEGKTINTPAQAVITLNKIHGDITLLLKKEKLTVSELEAIHEVSYTLETAIDHLIEKEAFQLVKLETIDEAVQAIHYGSEKHEEQQVREWNIKLGTAIKALEQKATAVAAHSADGIYEIFIKDHKFTPDEIRVPSGEKIKLIVHNQDPTPEEFESDDFRREKIIAGNSTATIFVGPLKPGKYHYFGEFNLKTANGYLYAE